MFTEPDVAAMRTLRDVTSRARRALHGGGQVTDPTWAELARTELADDHVVLRPIAEADREPLRAQAMEPAIWRYFVQLVETDEEFDAFFDAAVADQAAANRVVLRDHRQRVGAGRREHELLQHQPEAEPGWRSAGPGWAPGSTARASTTGRST